MSDTSPLFLGLDSSTQALKASLLTSTLHVLSELEVRFDRDLAHFGTRGGVLHGPEGSGEVFSPVMQPVEALDMLCEKIREAGWDVGRIRGISAAGQQHASVYWSNEATSLLGSLDPAKPFAEQLKGAFSRDVIPNWQDSSTVAECEALTKGMGGADKLAQVTGSAAHTRFTGAQIARFRRLFPAEYAATSRISLVSSFITTLMCADGEIKGIDESDACGMNMWDMSSPTRGWNKDVLAIIAGADGVDELERKLGTVETDGGRAVGHVGKWFQRRYGFNPECVVFPGTGDNPATFLSLVLRESEGLISLGTSDVVLVSTAKYNPHPEFHAFFHPAMIAPPSSQDTAPRKQHEQLRYFNMLVYKNGSLAREHVRDTYFDKSWDKFNAAVEKLRPKTAQDVPQRTAFWWLLPDIIPAGAHGVFKYEGHPASAAKRVEAFADVDAEALAILESQMLNYRTRSHAILTDATATSGPAPALSRIYATGGAAKNPTICSIAADALGCPVSKTVDWDDKTKSWVNATWNDCSVGVAYKARWGWERLTVPGKENVPFDDLIKDIKKLRREEIGDAAKAADGMEDGVHNVATPSAGAPAYEKAAQWWMELEARALKEVK